MRRQTQTKLTNESLQRRVVFHSGSWCLVSEPKNKESLFCCVFLMPIFNVSQLPNLDIVVLKIILSLLIKMNCRMDRFL